MPLITVRDNENTRWKRKAKTKDIEKKRGGPGYSKSVTVK